MKLLLFTLICIYNVWYTESCSCMFTHPQNLYCSADFVLQVRLRNKPVDIFKKHEVMKFDAVTNSSVPTIYRDKVAIKYNVKIKSVFKINDNESVISKDSKVAEVFTAPNGALCGVELSERVDYLIAGRYRDGEMHINLCSSFSTPWSWVTKYQKKGLRFTYKKNCACKIIREDSNLETASNTCTWDQFSRDADCYTRETACIHDKNSTTGGCKWQRRQKMRKCKTDKKSARQEP